MFITEVFNFRESTLLKFTFYFFAFRKGIHHKKADLWAMLHKAVKATRQAITCGTKPLGLTGRDKTQGRDDSKLEKSRTF